MRFARSYSADCRSGGDAVVIIVDVVAFLVWRGRCRGEGKKMGERGWTGGGHEGIAKDGEGEEGGKSEGRWRIYGREVNDPQARDSRLSTNKMKSASGKGKDRLLPRV